MSERVLAIVFTAAVSLIPADSSGETSPEQIPTPCVALCSGEGRCHLVDGECVARSRGDCRNTNACQDEGRCSARRGRCVALGDDCRRSELCVLEGRCTAVDGVCELRSSEDCQQSLFCIEDGRCTFQRGRCVQGPGDRPRAAPHPPPAKAPAPSDPLAKMLAKGAGPLSSPFGTDSALGSTKRSALSVEDRLRHRLKFPQSAGGLGMSRRRAMPALSPFTKTGSALSIADTCVRLKGRWDDMRKRCDDPRFGPPAVSIEVQYKSGPPTRVRYKILAASADQAHDWLNWFGKALPQADPVDVRSPVGWQWRWCDGEALLRVDPVGEGPRWQLVLQMRTRITPPEGMEDLCRD